MAMDLLHGGHHAGPCSEPTMRGQVPSPQCGAMFRAHNAGPCFQDYPSKASFGGVLNVLGVVFRGLGTVFEAFAGRCEGI